MVVNEEKTRFLVTIPKELKRSLEEIAKGKNRSLSNLVITVLMDYVEVVKG